MSPGLLYLTQVDHTFHSPLLQLLNFDLFEPLFDRLSFECVQIS